MRKKGDAFELSASDLANHLGCQHLTRLNLAVAEGSLEQPDWFDPALKILQERGLELEKAYLEHLKSQNLTISEPGDTDESSGIERTVKAMKEGVDIIYQAALESGRWQGRADFLRKVNKPSSLGDWSYEVIDTKLARETRAGTILQLCLYSQMVADIQQELPDNMHVITPEDGYTLLTYRINDFLAYHRLVQRRLEGAVNDNEPGTYPDPVPQCDTCRWWQTCDKRRRDDDHLCLVAGISKLQINEVKKWEVNTLEGLAALPLPLEQRPDRGAKETYERLREQARIQNEGRQTGKPIYELLPLTEGQGLYRLPEPSEGDVFLDFEGDPFVGHAGLEYLFGWTTGLSDSPEYHEMWALKPSGEKAAFEAFIDMIMERWQQHPNMHIYHFSQYEPATLKRLMGRHATRENELDSILRGQLFVDLHSVTKQTLRASVERYSLKDIETFYEFERKVALPEASSHLRAIERALELSNLEAITDDTRKIVAAYNSDDCISTMKLRGWLESLRNETIENTGQTIYRPETQSGDASEEMDEHQKRIQQLYEQLAADVPADPEERSQEQQARWLLANMLDWHRREKKPVWWEYFRLCDLPNEELIEEKAALSNLTFQERVDTPKRSVVDRYSYPAQDCDIRKDDPLKTSEGASFGSVVEVNLTENTIDIKKGPKIADTHPEAIFKHAAYMDGVKRDSLIRIAEWAIQNGIDSPGSYRAGRDLLLRHTPRTTEEFTKPEDLVILAKTWCKALDNSILPIQGPPGSGKTYTGANMITDLVRSGKKVGITALSHKVIRNLMNKAIEIAEGDRTQITCLQKISEPFEEDTTITETTKNEDVLSALQSGSANVVGGTTWLWAREELSEKVDVLFIDEAGQLSLVDVIAVSQAAKNIVLLGDPQQLQQPLQGSHPDGTEVSALQHILGEHQTIPPDQGIFLDKTWRLHPKICSFISELFYENRLSSRPNLDRQALGGKTQFAGAGLWFCPIEHEGNQSSSPEEVEYIVQLVNDLINGEVTWTDSQNETSPLTLSDILIIAPYNAQVAALVEALPQGARVGTVDKFQGQEAPVVIYSMSTSTPEEAPRGMEFLYNLNRLNVAVSRAKSTFILVANPKLFEPDCRSPAQMHLANAFCRYLEMVETI